MQKLLQKEHLFILASGWWVVDNLLEPLLHGSTRGLRQLLAHEGRWFVLGRLVVRELLWTEKMVVSLAAAVVAARSLLEDILEL